MYDPEEFIDYGPSDELSEKIHELVAEEVKRKMTETVEELEAANRAKKRLSEENRKLRQEVSGFEAEKKQLVKDMEIKIRREMFRGWNVGDTVFYPAKQYNPVKCPTCGGSHKLTVTLPDQRQARMDCPDCDYNGYLKNSGYSYVPEKERVETLSLSYGYQSAQYTCFYLKRQNQRREDFDRLFRTLEECQAYCDEQNKPKEESAK